jgi:hypothetical protein
MENALMLIGIIVAFGLMSVVVPAMWNAYLRYRRGVAVTCPQAHKPAELTVDCRRATLGAAFGKRLLRVTDCTLWPRKQPCHDECLREEDANV